MRNELEVAVVAALVLILGVLQLGCSGPPDDNVQQRAAARGRIADQLGAFHGYAPADAETWTGDEKKAIDLARGKFIDAMGTRSVVPSLYKVERTPASFMVAIIYDEYGEDRHLIVPSHLSRFVVELSLDWTFVRTVPVF